MIRITLDPNEESQRQPNGVAEVLRREKTKELKTKLLETDVLIYELENSDLEEVEFMINTFKTEKIEKQTTIIAISSTMVWANTPCKLVEKGEEIQEGEEVEQEEEELDEDEIEEVEAKQEETFGSENEQPKQEKQEEKPKELKKAMKLMKIPFKEEDFNYRKPAPKYEPLKQMECLLLSLAMNKENIKVYIVAAGMIYGCGELLLNFHFR